MGKSYEVTGEIHTIGETKAYGANGFEKREFVIKVTGPDESADYPNYLALEVVKDKCPLLDQFSFGQELKIQFNLGGRLWEGNGKGEKCFNSLQAWKLEAMTVAPAPQGNPHTPAPQIPEFDAEQDSDLPF